MFCDLVGSTALAAQLDPEDLRGLMGAYHAATSEEIRRFDGYVAQYLGDGVLAYFGYPRAHEDDAERAVRAGLRLVERVGALDVARPLEVRVAIATGLVVVGDLIGPATRRSAEQSARHLIWRPGCRGWPPPMVCWLTRRRGGSCATCSSTAI